ncbi:MAG: hypothetical protein FJ395_13805 [Verrucomicrobia bacterium]|nr:hypothetical protein [Verrucomicrobiota bacterium]
MKLVRHVLVVLLAAQLAGVTWLGLQAASKARQTCRNATQQGIVAALKRIPKGKGNCAMCKKIRIAKAKQAQEQRGGMPAGFVLPGFAPAVLTGDLFAPPPADNNRAVTAVLTVWHAREHSPPTPPPRA